MPDGHPLRAYLLWAIPITLLTWLPPVLYDHWAVSLLFAPEALLLISLLTFLILTWAILAFIEPARDPFIVTWSVIPIASYLLVAFAMPLFLGVELTHGIAYPIGMQAIVMPMVLGVGFLMVRVSPNLTSTYPDLADQVNRFRVPILILIVLIPVVIVGVAFATPADTTIDNVEPGFNYWTASGLVENPLSAHSFSGQEYTLAVTLDLDEATQRVVVENPEGERFYQPIPSSAAGEEAATVYVQANPYDRDTFATGTYTISVESIWGQTLDEKTLEVEQPASLDTVDTEVTSDGEGTVVAIDFEYAGDFPTHFAVSTNKPTIESDDITADAVGYTLVWGTVSDGDERDLEIMFYDDDDNRVALEPGTYELTITKSVRTANVDDFEQTITIEVPEE